MNNNSKPDPIDVVMKKLKRYNWFILPDSVFIAFKHLSIGTLLLAATGILFNSDAILFGCLVGLFAMFVPVAISIGVICAKGKYLTEQIIKCENQILQIQEEKMRRNGTEDKDINK